MGGGLSATPLCCLAREKIMRLQIISTVLLSLFILIGCQKQNKESFPSYCPIPIKKQMPEYPDILKRAGFEAVVEVSALVDEKGDVIDVQLINSSATVDSVCIEAAKQWKFKPGKISDTNGNYDVARFWFPIEFDWNTSREEIIK